MKIQKFTFNPFQENTYVIYDNLSCIIIDPGCYTKSEEKLLEEFIEDNKLNPIKILNTHAHIDHIFGNHFASKKWKIDVYMHKDELPILMSAENTAKIYDIKDYKPSPLPKHFINEKNEINLEGNILKIIFTPGHSPGHISFYNDAKGILFSGDVIFKNSIGRTDLPGGNYETLLSSIKSKVLELPKNTIIHCGHGDSTSIKEEIISNPFLNC